MKPVSIRASSASASAPLLLGRVQIRIQMNCASGDIQCLRPVGEAFLLHGDCMAAGCNGKRRGRVADKLSIDFDIPAGGRGVDR